MGRARNFTKEHPIWPDAADLEYRRTVFAYYGHDPYWE